MDASPNYPASSLYRLVDADTGLQVALMLAIHGVRSFASLRARAPKRLSPIIGLRADAALAAALRHRCTVVPLSKDVHPGAKTIG